jgi:death-on-curing protein
MISVEEVELIHAILIDSFGGSHGIRDMPALVSALSRPFQTFDGEDLYTTTLQKAAALIESLLANHPFVDGNKRTGYTVMRLFLLKNGFDIYASQEKKYNFVIGIAAGHSYYQTIMDWLALHVNEHGI